MKQPLCPKSVFPAGFSLLEVVLAMALFFGSSAVLSQLLLIGARAARWGEQMTEATLRCESKMSDLVSGAARLEARDGVPFPDDEDWQYSVDVTPTPIPSLVRVTLTVVHRVGERQDIEVGLARLFATSENADIARRVPLASTAPSQPLSVEEMLGLTGGAP
jgi:type II secretory pathway pseudopilin PulG